MKKNPFEKSSADKEKKGGPKEGSKREEFMDMIQSKKKGMKCGGKVKGKSAGGVMRGAGAATKGTRFSRSG